MNQYGWASTFVDNGGTIYESELRVTVEQLKQAIYDLKFEDPKDLCTCEYRREASLTCSVLDNLSSQEADACRKFLTEHRNDLLIALKNASFELSSEPLVHGDQGNRRPVQAGATKKNMRIIVNQDNFVTLHSTQRIMLIAHELGHLISFNGNSIRDNELIAGVKGRVLLDATGAALGALAHKNWTTSTSTDRTLSKSYKRHWLSLLGGTLKINQKDLDKSLIQESLPMIQMSYRYQQEPYGFQLSYKNISRTSIDDYSSTLNIQRYQGSFSYMRRIFQNRVGFWGHSHLLLQAGLAWSEYEHTLSDQYVEIKSQDASLTPTIEGKVLLPFYRGFWFEGFYGMDVENFASNKTKIQLENFSLYSGFGVNYAF